jgi:putative phosphoesterase
MKIAVISDIHGNRVALDHVLDEISADLLPEQGDQIVCLGDLITLGPDPVGVLRRVRDLGCVNILGNHDEFMLDLKKVREYTKVPAVIRSVEWAHELLSEADRSFFKSFKTEHEIVAQGRRVRFFHGSPTSHSEDVTANMSPAKLDQLVGGVPGDVLVFGHTHLQMLIQHQGRYILNPGSLGSPFKELFFCEAPTVYPYAEYAMIEILEKGVEISLRRTYPDFNQVIQSVESSDYPLKSFLIEQYRRYQEAQ